MKIPKKRKSKKPILLLLGLTIAAIFLVTNIENLVGLFEGVTDTTTKEVVKAATTVVADKKSICLDPGHGGDDQGATNGSLIESELNLDLANIIRTKLTSDGYTVYMTRTDNNTYLTNSDRVNYCNAKNADILVSVHHNYFSDTVTDYSTALFYNDNSRGLAAALANETSKILNTTNNGIAVFEDGILMRAKMPAALAEGIFITNSSEYSQLITSDTRLNDEAAGIVNGIELYFKDSDQRPTQVTTLDQAE